MNSAPAAAAIASGETTAAIGDYGTLEGIAKQGRIRLIAITDGERSPAMPDVPTVAESGYPSVVSSGWTMIFAPGGTPPEVVDRLNAAFTGALKDPEVVQLLESWAMVPDPTSPEDAEKFQLGEIEKWGKVIREANIKPE